MTFPTTSVLDTFTRADENPLSFGGKWSQITPFDTEDLKLVSNGVLKNTTTSNTWGSRYWNPTTFNPNCEAYVTLSTRPTNNGEQVGLFVRADQTDLTNFPSYELIYTRVTAGTDTLNFQLYPTGGGPSSQLGSTMNQNINSGDSFGFGVESNVLTAYYKPSGGSWTSVGNTTSSAHNGSGSIGLEIGGSGTTGTAKVTNFGGGTLTSQFARPSSDVTAAAWTVTPLWSKIDEVVADDADFIQSDVVNFGNVSSTCEVALSAVTDPNANTGHIVRLRTSLGFGDGFDKLTIQLMQGATSISTFVWTLILQGFFPVSWTLTAAEADSITNYGDLRFDFSYTSSPSDTTGSSSAVSWIELEVPAIAGPTIVTSPMSLHLRAGEIANFSVSATGTGVLHYQWKRDFGSGFTNVGSDQNTYSFSTVSVDNNDLIEVVATDDVGNTTSSVATVFIDPTVLVPKSIFNPSLVPAWWV